jgi:hypothetical protein
MFATQDLVEFANLVWDNFFSDMSSSSFYQPTPSQPPHAFISANVATAISLDTVMPPPRTQALKWKPLRRRSTRLLLSFSVLDCREPVERSNCLRTEGHPSLNMILTSRVARKCPLLELGSEERRGTAIQLSPKKPIFIVINCTGQYQTRTYGCRCKR